MSAGPDWSQVGATLGQDFHIMRLTLQRRHGFTHADVERLHVATYKPALEIACHAHPRSVAEARFSLHYAVATALVHGSVRLAAYEPARLNDPATQAMMSRITAVVDPDIDAGFPERRAARVEVILRNGRRFTHFQPHRKGDPELPLSDSELSDRLIDVTAAVIGDGAARALLDKLWLLDTRHELP
jgi:2-methylcitrate dehydratase PrpD